MTNYTHDNIKSDLLTIKSWVKTYNWNEINAQLLIFFNNSLKIKTSSNNQLNLSITRISNKFNSTKDTTNFIKQMYDYYNKNSINNMNNMNINSGSSVGGGSSGRFNLQSHMNNFSKFAQPHMNNLSKFAQPHLDRLQQQAKDFGNQVIDSGKMSLAQSLQPQQYNPQQYNPQQYNPQQYNQPLQNDPLQNESVQNQPMQNQPMQNQPMQNEPMQNELLQNQQIQSPPIQNVLSCMSKCINNGQLNSKLPLPMVKR